MNKNEKLLKFFLVQGPVYTKRPFGHRVSYPSCIPIFLLYQIKLEKKIHFEKHFEHRALKNAYLTDSAYQRNAYLDGRLKKKIVHPY